MARLRMGCSRLNMDLWKLKVLPNSRCQCGHEPEDLFHFFFVCPRYTPERIELMNLVYEYIAPTAQSLLNGSKDLDSEVNEKIYDKVLWYVAETKRFG